MEAKNSEWVLETARLGLRELTMDDLPAWERVLCDVETMRYYPAPFDREKVVEWINWNIENYAKYGFGLWAVVLKETGEFVGDCGMTMQNIRGDGVLLPEIGFHIDRHFWRRGYASEAAKECLRFAFERTDFPEVFCYQKSTNLPSRKMAEKMGMTLRAERPDPKNTVTSVFSITRAEYELKNRKLLRSMLQMYVKGSAEAVELYKNAFGAEVLCVYPDENGGYMHSELNAFGQILAVSELREGASAGNTMQFCLHFGAGGERCVERAYEILKPGAVVECPLGSCDYSDLMFALTDKFNIRWCLFV